MYELGDGIFEWLCDHLGDRQYEPHDDSIVEPTELQCTPRGSVRDAYTDERTIDDLIREYVAENFDAGTTPAVDDEYANRLRRTLVETFDLDREGCELSPRFIEQTTTHGMDVEHVWFKTERDPDIVVTGILVSDPESTTDSPAIVLYERGTTELSERSEEVASLASEYGAAFVFDPRGVGAVQNRVIPIPEWVDAYDDIYGTEFKLAYDALQLGSSLLGMRVFDVLRAAAFLRSETDVTRVSFVGEGIGALHALYAGTVAHHVDRIALRNAPPSFFEMTTGQNAPFHPQLTVFDVIGECDVPQLLAALDQRGVQVDTEDGSMR